MNLISLTLENFKGIKAFTLDATGQNVDVYGSNGCGKSTLFDGFFSGRTATTRRTLESRPWTRRGRSSPALITK